MQKNHLLANAIRFLAMDAVEKAKSGHPGMPMGMADIATVLWLRFLKFNPNNPFFPNRDRFVLSNGHGSMLLYALLHLSGFDLSIEELKSFRQFGSKTPGHPEYGRTPGVETTTGPLGQGLANAVGMAIAEKHLAAYFNRPTFSIIDHYTYAFVGDGCLMEGISHEACSLAGTLGLGKLIVFYDDNGISIDGETKNWFTDDTAKRFEAYHWQVIGPIDGHDQEQIAEAIKKAQANTDQPSLILCKTKIGYGAPTKVGLAKTHGAPLGEKEIEATRQALSWPYAPFEIPTEVYEAFDARKKGAELEAAWQNTLFDYEKAYPDLFQALQRRFSPEPLPADFLSLADLLIKNTQKSTTPLATRKASQHCLSAFSERLPELWGGSADLTESNGTDFIGARAFSKDYPLGNYLHFGVREFGMAAIANGLALHGGLIPFIATFLVFSDYCRNAIRLAAMMQSKVIFLFSHDSIALGEDGPTHQPIEQLSSLRLIPNLTIWRPCDAVETSACWMSALSHSGPSCILLTRQNVPVQPRDEAQLKLITYGAYILSDVEKTQEIQAIIMATGSEVALAMQAQSLLKAEQIFVRVVSIPSVERFLAQPLDYQESVLPQNITKRVIVEAGSRAFWYPFAGKTGKIIGIDHFGESAPAHELLERFGLTKEAVVNAVKDIL